MLRFIFPIMTLGAIVTMGACSGSSDPVAENADNPSASQAEIDVLPPDEGDSSSINEVENNASPLAAGTIPASLQGRWGMTPDDCTSTRGDAKGLLIVSPDSLKFYESVARPAGELKTSDDSASGDFAFTGEGMTWKKYEALELQDNKLVRTESKPMASFAYARCS